MRAIALGVRFVLELCILGALAAWAADLRVGVVEKIIIGGASCLAAAIIWGMILSPKRRFDLAAPNRLAIEAAFFLIAAAALFDIGHWALAIVLLAAALAQQIALAVFR